MYFEFKAVDRNSIAIVDKHKEKMTGVVVAVTHFFRIQYNLPICRRKPKNRVLKQLGFQIKPVEKKDDPITRDVRDLLLPAPMK